MRLSRGGAALGALAFVLAGAVLAMPAAPAAGEGSSAVVAGSGTFEAAGGVPVHVTAAVHRTRTDQVTGFFRHRSDSGGVTVRATCLRVAGDRALVGGIIVESTVPGQVGMPAALAVDDRWPPGGAPDRVSMGLGPAADQCPVSPDQIAGPWDELVRGNFTIAAAG